MAITLLGHPVAHDIQEKIRHRIEFLRKNTQRVPGLAVILVGENPASQAYVGMKKKACAAVGITSFEHLLPSTATEIELESLIHSLNQDPSVNGILLQLPLPKGLNEASLLQRISPDKDVDGFHPLHIGNLLLGLPSLKPCTPYGVCELLKYYNIPTQGKHVVVLGRSNIVGKPLAAMLIQREFNATVTICHSHTENLAEITQQGDILISAIGKPHFVTEDMVKDRAIVIDVGINRVPATPGPGFILVGDVDYDSVEPKVSAITPVPKGVGPMTIAMLMKNTLTAFEETL